VSLAKRAFSTVGKLGIIIAIVIAFFIGLFGTVYLSLRSPEVKVPDVVGKDVLEGEAALDHEGLNMRRRAERFSPNVKPNTILGQEPQAGAVIKVGQTVAVVVSRANAKEGESPVSAPTAEDKAAAENKNTSESTSSSKNDNDNDNRGNKNTRSKNANNSNNSNNGNNNLANRNANNRNANTNNRNANERDANNRNANRGGGENRNNNVRTLNIGNANASGTPGANRSPAATNSNRRAPATNPNSNRSTP
jgi:hypothetical protein